ALLCALRPFLLLPLRPPPFLFSCPVDHRLLHFSLHDALPISQQGQLLLVAGEAEDVRGLLDPAARMEGDQLLFAKAFNVEGAARSEEHTSELQSRENLVCRLLLEKKKDI